MSNPPPVPFQELNLSNYNSDDVAQLDEWAIWAAGELERLAAEVAVIQAENMTFGQMLDRMDLTRLTAPTRN